jgi:hypothetical protein
MATLGSSLEKIVTGAATQLGRSQTAINKVLWGNGNTQPVQTVKYDAASGSLSYKTTPTVATPPAKGNILNTGLYNALDALNSVDLCNVLTYLTDNINVKRKPRPPQQTWNQSEKVLYRTQDKAALVVTYIDKYTAFPNEFIGSYLGVGPNAVSAETAISQSGAPAGSNNISGTNIQKYNMYNLIQSIKETFATGTGASSGSLLTPEEQTLLTTVPGLGGNLNFVDNFLGSVNKYGDYRSISNSDLQKLQNQISKLRSVCVTVQNLDFRNTLAIAGNLLNTDVRSQIQQLSKFLDVTKIIPTLKQINSAIRTFIRIANIIQGLLRVAQFIIKLAILFTKVFKFIIAFFIALPVPSLLTTTGIQILFNDAKQTAKNNNDSLIKLLKEINALLAVITIFIRYLLANANELLIRLQTLLTTLEGCEAVKDSDVIAELKLSVTQLTDLRDELANYIIKHDSKTDPNTAVFGTYDIRVVDEEITDRSVRNKRRRGIALDQNGFIVTQSDLTFATNTAVIIEEVKQKLVSAGLVQPSLGSLNAADLAVISESLDYLDSNDVMQDDLNVQTFQNQDTPDNENENLGIGLNAFINKLPGGRRLRARVRKSLDSSNSTLKSQIGSQAKPVGGV